MGGMKVPSAGNVECRSHGQDRCGSQDDRGGDRGESIQPDVVGGEKLLTGDAVVLALPMIGIGMHRMLIVAASVHDTDLLDKAHQNPVVMMGHDRREQDHHHRQQVRYNGYLPKHSCKDIYFCRETQSFYTRKMPLHPAVFRSLKVKART